MLSEGMLAQNQLLFPLCTAETGMEEWMASWGRWQAQPAQPSTISRRTIKRPSVCWFGNVKDDLLL